MRIHYLVVLVALVAPPDARAQTNPATAPSGTGSLYEAAAIERLVDESMAKSGSPSYVVGIVVGEQLVYAKAFGLADVAQNRAATVDTIYQVGSLTKTFTATLLCALRDDGKLRLDDPVAQFLPPDVKLPTDPLGAPAITLRHLATHTSGLPGNPVNRRDVLDSPSVMMPYAVRELYEGLKRTQLDAPTGTRWRYSNLGVGLLGLALERAGGEPYEALLKRRLLEPLGMTSTTVTLSDEQLARFATHYWYGDASRTPRQRWMFGEVCGFGGVASTVPDLAKYVAMYLRQSAPEAAERPVMRGATLRELCAPQRMTSPRWRQAQALGWFVERTDEDVEMVAHGGEVDGNSSFLAFAPQLGVGAIVLANTGRDAATIVGEPLIRQMIRAAAADRTRALELAKAEKWNEAIEALQAVLARAPADAEAWAALGAARLSAGRNEPALEAFGRAVRLGHNRMNSAYNAACAAARAGKADEAFHWLTAAQSHGFRDREQAETDADLASLRGDSRWQDALPALMDQLLFDRFVARARARRARFVLNAHSRPADNRSKCLSRRCKLPSVPHPPNPRSPSSASTGAAARAARAGWINSDRQSGPGVDYVCDVRGGLPIPADSLDYAVSVHALQEVALVEQVTALTELHRVLRPGGVLRLCLPDAEKAIRAYLTGERDYFVVPDEDFASLGGKFVAHLLWYGHSRVMYTFDFVEELLLRAGFARVHRCAYRRSQSGLSGITDLDDRARETLFVEAAKTASS